jgi:hypothetical protein
MFLSGGKALSVSESEAAVTDMSVSDISIGLLQGATAGTSDAIMDATPPETPPETIIAPRVDLTSDITVSESETLMKMDEVPPTALQMDNVFSAG